MSASPDLRATEAAGRRRLLRRRVTARAAHIQSGPRSRPILVADIARRFVRVEPGRLRGLAAFFRRPGFARTVAHTAGFNVASTVAAGLSGVVIARAVGPTVRGEYAAVTAWFSVVVIIGGVGQQAAVCFYVARDPLRARDYVATSRAMMVTTGMLTLAVGILLSSLLGRGNAGVAVGYRIAFATSLFTFVGASYTSSLQARDLHRWNVLRTIQPALSLVTILVLWRLELLTLDIALVVLAVTILLQLCWAYWSCRRVGLLPGRACPQLVRPLFTYGAAQIAALTPAVLNAQLDQLVLSLTVSSADLGRYAIAVSLTLLPVPAVTAIGYVAFPRLASQREVTDATRRLQRLAVVGSIGLTAGMLLPLAVLAPWLVPLVFGPAYRGAVPLLWILAPGAVLLACGQVVGDLLRGRSHPGVVAWAQGLAAIFTVVLLFALLPVVGVPGAAIASTVSYGIALAVMLRRLWRLPRHARGNSSKASAFSSDLRRNRKRACPPRHRSAAHGSHSSIRAPRHLS
jgi:O-antigen/teichoic acid export membrane protein